MKIPASKNLGKLYYMVDSFETLKDILESEYIVMSSKKEMGADQIRSYGASLTRNPKALYHQNKRRWCVGIILDSSKLTENYKVEPYHYVGTQGKVNHTTRTLNLQTLTAYDTEGQYEMNLAGWSAPIPISKKLFDALWSICESLPENVKTRCHLTYSEGKRKRNGRIFTRRYYFNVAGGGPYTIIEDLQKDLYSEFVTNPYLNQQEERIQGPTTSKNLLSRFRTSANDETNIPVVSIKNAAIGYISSSQELRRIEDENPETLDEIEAILHTDYNVDDVEIESL